MEEQTKQIILKNKKGIVIAAWILSAAVAGYSTYYALKSISEIRRTSETTSEIMAEMDEISNTYSDATEILNPAETACLEKTFDGIETKISGLKGEDKKNKLHDLLQEVRQKGFVACGAESIDRTITGYSIGKWIADTTPNDRIMLQEYCDIAVNGVGLMAKLHKRWRVPFSEDNKDLQKFTETQCFPTKFGKEFSEKYAGELREIRKDLNELEKMTKGVKRSVNSDNFYNDQDGFTDKKNTINQIRYKGNPLYNPIRVQHRI